MSPMKSSGISTAISETVSERMVKPICSEPLSAASQRRLALLDVARDVLDHHDGVVDHEAGGDGERHQREVVQAVAEQVHDAERADERERHGDARDDGGGEVAQEEEDHHARPARRSASARTARPRTEARIVVGAVGEDRDLDRRRAASAWSCGRSCLMRSTTSMMLAPGWRWMLTITAGVVVHPGRLLDVLGVVDRRRRRRTSRTGAPLR